MIVGIVILFIGIIILAIICINQHEDLKEYRAIVESTMENNDKLIKINKDVMTANEDLNNRVEKWEKLCIQQNDLCESVIKDNLEITAKVSQVLMHIDDGK